MQISSLREFTTIFFQGRAESVTVLCWVLGSVDFSFCFKDGAYILLIKMYFRVVYDYAGKVDLSKGYGNPKRKLGVTTQFLEIIKQQLF